MRFGTALKLSTATATVKIFTKFPEAVDVIGHEMTHGVTQNASALIYQGEPGALNEHLSDVFGSLIKQRLKGQDAASASWLIGESVIIAPDPLQAGQVCRGVRDLLHPGTAYVNLAFGSDPQPDCYANLNKDPADNFGVHINSGIPNRAFAMYAIAIGGNAWDIAGKVWYQAATASGLPAKATFSQFRATTLATAQAMASTTVPALIAAWNAVGVM
jgi:Zn-dependent metalloprotease